MSTHHKTDLISVIIPAYNVEKVLSRCLESINRQTYSNLEIVVINDGSTDATLFTADKCCKNLQREGHTMVVYSQKNGGASSARNLGLRLAKGKYICFVDADDTMDEGYIQGMYNELIEREGDLVIAGCCNRDSNSGALLYEDSPQRHIMKLGKDTLVFWGVPWGKLYNRDTLIQNECWFSEGELFEDDPYSLMVHVLSNDIVILDNAGYNYYVNNSQSVSQKPFPENFPYRAFEYSVQMCMKHGGSMSKLNGYLASLLFNKLFRGFRRAPNRELKKITTFISRLHKEYGVLDIRFSSAVFPWKYRLFSFLVRRHLLYSVAWLVTRL